MVRNLTCIMCPMGCDLTATCVGDADGETKSVLVEGNTCPKGRDYAIQELTDPRRNIASSVSVDGGELPLASVRLTGTIPKARIFDVMNEIRRQRLEAPVRAGQVVISNVLGLGVDVIATRHVNRI